METQPVTIEVSPSIGNVSGVYVTPEISTCVMTLAHGAGAGMNHSFMVTLAEYLAEKGIATLRFNFPFIEHGKKRTDMPPVAHATVQAAIQHAHDAFPDLPLFVSGKSFGGRMSSQHLALHSEAFVKGIVFYGFPLHLMDKPSTERAAHLKDVTVPMLFLQGTRDALATLHLIEEVTSSLKGATLLKIEGADHAFKAGKHNTLQVLADATEDWTRKLIEPPFI